MISIFIFRIYNLYYIKSTYASYIINYSPPAKKIKNYQAKINIYQIKHNKISIA